MSFLRANTTEGRIWIYNFEKAERNLQAHCNYDKEEFELQLASGTCAEAVAARNATQDIHMAIFHGHVIFKADWTLSKKS